MKRPRARAGLTPISSRVLTAEDEPELELGVGGGGDPDIVGGTTRCIGGRVWIGGTPGGAEDPLATTGTDCGVGCAVATAAPEAAGELTALTPETGATPDVGGTVALLAPARRCGSLAMSASSSFTVCGRWLGSFASTFASSWSSSSGRLGFSPTADGIGELTVEYATSMRFAPV